MNWTDFYLICFLVGLGLSVVSLMAGGIHLHGPHGHIHLGGHHAGGHHHGLPHLNIGTVTAFLAWFGGTGYLLTRYYTVWFLTVIGVSTLSGLGGAALVALFLAKFLMRGDEVMDPADYEMVGVLGKVSSIIRPGGTGEMIYSQAGTRRGVAVRSDDGAEINRGIDVVVTRYERGVAWVRPWDDLVNSQSFTSEKQGKKETEQQ